MQIKSIKTNLDMMVLQKAICLVAKKEDTISDVCVCVCVYVYAVYSVISFNKKH